MREEDWGLLRKLGYPEDNQLVKALYKGGEEYIERIVGDNYLFPYSLEEILRIGINQLYSDVKPILTAHHVEERIRNSLEAQEGFSLIRLGDGELLSLAHDVLIPTPDILAFPRLNFLHYAGISIPDHESRDYLAKLVPEADIIGIPTVRYPTFQPLFIKLIKYYKWPLEKLKLTNSVINYQLFECTSIYQDLLKQYKVLLIGNRMKDGKLYFESRGYKVAGAIPVENIKAVPKVIEVSKDFEYDVAFVSAGISANLICIELAKQNKVAIDFGHLIDEILRGTKTF